MVAAAAMIVMMAGSPPCNAQAAGGYPRLTFADSGLYTNLDFSFRHGQGRPVLPDLLTPQRAESAESPWGFYIIQVNSSDISPSQVAMLKDMAENGKRIIIRAGIGREHPNPDPAKMEEWLANLFRTVKPSWVYAITLGEEQVYWNGWASALSDLYYRVKKRWPNLQVYQWWTPMVAPDVHAKSGWVALPADGWVMDLYGLHAKEFETQVRKFLETDKPVVDIAWASPTWILYDGSGYTEVDWWDQAGSAVLEEQLSVCKKFDIPVAFFVVENEIRKGKKVIRPMRWGWESNTLVVRQWFLLLEKLVGEHALLSFSR